MTYLKSARFFVFFLILAEVAPWTIDLPEVRRHLFSKENKKYKNEYKEYIHTDHEFYSNIQGNSMHNSEEYERNKNKHGEEHGESPKEKNKGQPHEHYEHEKYADEFGHHSYMEQKVQEIVHDGSVYLEGLRRSLEEYSRFLEGCNKRNMSTLQNTKGSTTWTPPVVPSPTNMTMNFNTTDTRFQNISSDMAMMAPNVNSTQSNFNRTDTTRPRMTMSCHEAIEVSEKVRRYADLAMWATRRLQDIAYAGKYQKTDKYEENELILKLAWFLDKLALLTGYEPDYKQYLPQITTAIPTTSPMPATLVPQTEELKNFLIKCVKANSSIPATIRCQYPLPLPDMVAQIVGGTSTSPPRQDTGDVVPITEPDSNPQQSMELLITSDDTRTSRTPRKITKRSPIPEEYYVGIPVHEKPKPIVDFIVKKLSNLKSIVKSVKKHAVADFASQIAIHKHLHKRSIDDNTSVLLNRLSNVSKPIVETNKSNVEIVSPIHLPVLEVSVINTKSFKKRSIEGNDNNLYNLLSNSKLSVKKRSVDDPLSNLAKYYVKHKIWESSNPKQENNNKIVSNFDVNNNLQAKHLSKRSIFRKKNTHFQIFKPFNFLHYKNKQRRFHSAKKGKDKLFLYVRNIFDKKSTKFEKNRHKIFKRSLLYEHMYLPRIPYNPVGDISYYIKSKDGTMYNPSLTQAAQVRLGLQQVFETGNIEVVHRYGSNYNPANPAPFTTGILKGSADS